MKIIFSFLLSCLFLAVVNAQAPQKMSYQAVIRQNNSQLVTNAVVGMRISILQGSANGSVVYAETHAPVTNANGLASLEIGGGTIISGTFATIDWANGPFFVKMETDPAGGTNYTVTGTTQLLSVPYALYAETSGTPGPQGPPGPSGSAGNFAHYIGELFEGGIIVGLWRESGVEHGLIASLTDVSTGSQWSNINANIGLTASNSSSGEGNTNAIIAQPGHVNSAAKVCSDYSAGGFTDWYLPSVLEIHMCFDVAGIVNIVLGNSDGLGVNYGISYWSSTECPANATAWTIDMPYYNIVYNLKNELLHVRAVRRF